MTCICTNNDRRENPLTICPVCGRDWNNEASNNSWKLSVARTFLRTYTFKCDRFFEEWKYNNFKIMYIHFIFVFFRGLKKNGRGMNYDAELYKKGLEMEKGRRDWKLQKGQKQGSRRKVKGQWRKLINKDYEVLKHHRKIDISPLICNILQIRNIRIYSEILSGYLDLDNMDHSKLFLLTRTLEWRSAHKELVADLKKRRQKNSHRFFIRGNRICE